MGREAVPHPVVVAIAPEDVVFRGARNVAPDGVAVPEAHHHLRGPDLPELTGAPPDVVVVAVAPDDVAGVAPDNGVVDSPDKVVGLAIAPDDVVVGGVGPDKVAVIAPPDVVGDGVRAIRAAKETEGTYVNVSDDEILNAISELGKVGVFAEPAGAAAFAGLIKGTGSGVVGSEDPILVLNTGSGLKDIRAAMSAASSVAAPVIKPTLRAVKRVI